MEHLKNYMKNIYKVTDSDWDLVKESVHTDQIGHGEYFLRDGQVCHWLGFIEKGVMRYLTFSGSGKELTCNFASEDEFIGEAESFFQRKPCYLNLQAITDCTIATIGYDDFKNIIAKFPLFLKISEDISYRTVVGLLNKKNFPPGSSATAKYRQFVQQYPQIIQRVPLGIIASYLEITQQSLSRIRKQV
jgi:CRP-like cAMP-binding protein